MPQNRRAQQLMMKHRASSLSALGHSGASGDGSGSGEDNSNNTRSGGGRQRHGSFSQDTTRNSFMSESTRDSVSSICSSYLFDEGDGSGNISTRLSYLIEEEDLDNPKKAGEVEANNNSSACDMKCSTNSSEVGCIECKLCSSCKADCNCQSDQSDKLKDADDVTVRNVRNSGAVRCTKCNKDVAVEIPPNTAKKSTSNSHRTNPPRKSSLMIETVETVTFDDIDDFFKSSRTIMDESRDSQEVNKSNPKKKKVTMDEKNIKETTSRSALTRFRNTLTSFRRVRFRTGRDLTDCHPDEANRRKSKSFCVIL